MFLVQNRQIVSLVKLIICTNIRQQGLKALQIKTKMGVMEENISANNTIGNKY